MGVESDPRAGEVLLALARSAIASSFGAGSPSDDAPWLAEPGAVFVTLTQGGQLRGCIGSLEAHRSLLDDVTHNARAAAFSDPRFPPLEASDLLRTRIEVSLLSPPELLPPSTEEEVLGLLRPGVDGVILTWHGHRGTFLPQVWEQLPDPGDFLARLRLKAGLPATFWDADVRVHRYTVTAWKETTGEGSP